MPAEAPQRVTDLKTPLQLPVEVHHLKEQFSFLFVFIMLSPGQLSVMSCIFSTLNWFEISLHDHLLHHIMQWVASPPVKFKFNLAVTPGEHRQSKSIVAMPTLVVSKAINYSIYSSKLSELPQQRHNAALCSTAQCISRPQPRKLASQQLRKVREATTHTYESPPPVFKLLLTFLSSLASFNLCSFSPHIWFSFPFSSCLISSHLFSSPSLPPPPSLSRFFLPSFFLPPPCSLPPLFLQPPLLFLSCQVKPGHQAFEDLKVI